MKRNIISTIIFAIFLLLVFILNIGMPKQDYSINERRFFANLPKWIENGELNEDFMSDFELYSADHFPLRESFRSIKGLFSKYVFNKLDTNGLFVVDGHISKIDTPVNDKMIKYSSDLFLKIYEKYLKDSGSNVYLSVIPDKNYFLADKNGYPSMDYDSFIHKVKEQNQYMEYIDVIELLSANDYYYTDTHWKQDCIVDVANSLLFAMGKQNSEVVFIENTLTTPFNGVYKGQLSMPFGSDTIKYLTNNTIDNSVVYYYDNGTPEIGDMYNMDKAVDKDPYEMFLSGVAPFIVLENTKIDTEDELIIFRDSFGSSIAPIMLGGYKKITLIDLRYMQSSILDKFIDFKDKDVLFLYSTTILNNSMSMR